MTSRRRREGGRVAGARGFRAPGGWRGPGASEERAPGFCLQFASPCLVTRDRRESCTSKLTLHTRLLTLECYLSPRFISYLCPRLCTEPARRDGLASRRMDGSMASQLTWPDDLLNVLPYGFLDVWSNER